jgi:hydrogenase-4 component B
MFYAQFLLSGMIIFWLLGFCLILITGRRVRLSTYLSLGCAASGSACGLIFGLVYFFYSAEPFSFVINSVAVSGLPQLDFEIYVDKLALLFVILISLTGLIVSIYSFSFLESEKERIAAFFNLYLLAMIGVVIANNVLFFLIFWELMTLASAYMVLYQHNKALKEAGPEGLESASGQDALTSPRVYLIASHVSTVLLTIALLWLAVHADSFSFTVLRQSLAPATSSYSWIFLLTLAGCGIKAGMVPFHIWLPYAHPTSPANIHAIMSGVMIKIAIYALIRMTFNFLWTGERWWWGEVVLALGAVTAFIGVLYAIFHTNLKTALAYHSIENMGIIIIGVGLAMIFSSGGEVGTRNAMLASLALIASLYHLVNHAFFKGLLFLCTGAIEKLTGTVEMEDLGGLAKRFPWTSSTFGVGALAISGFPPFNGFVSEWLVLQALLAGFCGTSNTIFSPAQMLIQIISLMLLVGAFALTAFCFVKICATVFLGHPRNTAYQTERHQKDVAWPMRGSLLFLALGCLLLGLLPHAVIGFLSPIAGQVFHAGQVGAPLLQRAGAMQFVLPTATGADTGATSYLATLQIYPLFIVGIVLGLGVYGLTRLSTRGGRRESASEVWSCGSEFEPRRMQFTDAAFTFWILQTFSGLLKRHRIPGQVRTGAMSEPDKRKLRLIHRQRLRRKSVAKAHIYFRDKVVVTYGVVIQEVFRTVLNKLLLVIDRFSEMFGMRVQNGDVRSYLLYIFLVILLVFLILIPFVQS